MVDVDVLFVDEVVVLEDVELVLEESLMCLSTCLSTCLMSR